MYDVATMVEEFEDYELVRGKGRELVEWRGQWWRRYARWYERAAGGEWKGRGRGPFPTRERARAIFVEEVERRLAEGFRWASKARFGRGASAAAPEPKRSKAWAKAKQRLPAWMSKAPAAERNRVRAILDEADLAHRAADIMTLARPAIRFTLAKAKAPSSVTTRFGGAPDLPAGTAWPMNGDTPLAFVAQLRLDELARFDFEAAPS